jgi:hypothetical protein
VTRLPRRARAVLRFVAPCVFGIAAGGYALPALLAQDWILALWAGFTAVWTFLYAAHSCPPPPPAPEPPVPATPEPEPVERGQQVVIFRGGPEDGGERIVHPGRDLVGAELHVSGADYEVTAVEQTAFRADFVQLVHRADAGDR